MSIQFFTISAGTYPKESQAATAMKNAVVQFFTNQGFTGSSTSLSKGGFTVKDISSGTSSCNFKMTTVKYSRSYTSYVQGSGSEYYCNPMTVCHITTEHGEYWCINSYGPLGIGRLSNYHDGSLDSVTSECAISLSSGTAMWRDVSSTTSPSWNWSGVQPYIHENTIYVSPGCVSSGDYYFNGNFGKALTPPEGYTLSENYQSGNYVILTWPGSSTIYISQLPF